MRKFFLIIFSLISIFIIILITVLSTVGVETEKFNNLISQKINQVNNNINLKLTSIKFKIDIQQISLFLETSSSQINYRDMKIPTKNIKVYIDFISLVKSEPEVRKIALILEEININELKELSTAFKPSNFTNLIKNKIKEGKLNSELEIYLNKNNILENFIIKGKVSNLKAETIDGINFNKAKFSFFADKSDVLIKTIYGEIGPVKVIDGDLKFNLSSEILLESNFQTKINYNNQYIKFKNMIKDIKFAKNLINLEADINNTISINFDETYKVKKYNYKNQGKILKADFGFDQSLKSTFLKEKIKKISFVNLEVNTNLNSKKNNTTISGKYSLNEGNFLQFNLDNINNDELLKLNLDAEYDKLIDLEFINYKKLKNTITKFSLDLEKKKNIIKIKKINLVDKDSSIFLEDIVFDKGKFLSLKKVQINTSKDNIKNNDFSVLFEKDILIKGNQFDASNLPKIFNKKKTKNQFSQLSKNIEIDFENITAPLSENLKNFKLIGKIEKGKFVKISAKGDFGENNFLDITMKKDKKSKKKFLEVYSDLTKPLLTEYSFFKGLTGGKLLYTSIIDDDDYNSKLKIENFNLINAPGMVKLLSLADLSGLADLAEGEGLSFDILEIKMEKNGDNLKLTEILALGPSISVLMEGYQNPTITSLRGTLVPAKTLNKMISKIPVLGNIIIPKEAGEGLFGISFKMKGPPGKIKTTINPIKTITPRFIQKIIEKKNSK